MLKQPVTQILWKNKCHQSSRKHNIQFTEWAVKCAKKYNIEKVFLHMKRFKNRKLLTIH